jgi:hypothetical protein
LLYALTAEEVDRGLPQLLQRWRSGGPDVSSGLGAGI